MTARGPHNRDICRSPSRFPTNRHAVQCHCLKAERFACARLHVAVSEMSDFTNNLSFAAGALLWYLMPFIEGELLRAKLAGRVS